MHRRLLAVLVVFFLAVTSALATTTGVHRRRRRVVHWAASVKFQRVSYTRTVRRTRRSTGHLVARRRRVASPWTSPTFADSTIGDSVRGEDLLVRRAAVRALGPYNGSVVVADPSTGRILTLVNQKLAMHGAFEPCSTIKIVAALAGLSEGVINQEQPRRITRQHRMD